MTSTYVDPWLAGKERLAATKAQGKAAAIEAKANGKAAVILAKAQAEESKEQRKEKRTRERWARWAAAVAAAWAKLRSSWYEALWLPVIVAPGVLAWQGQTDAGKAIYGDNTGWLLALFTETAAWVVAFYVEAARRRNPDMPVGRGRAAVWLVASAAAAMNYLHGAQTSWWHGVVMAVVSIGGIALHQIAHTLRSRSESGVSGAEIRARAARWLFHPLWSMRAASIAAARGIEQAEAFERLWLDHWGTDAVGRQERRLARAARVRVADLERAAASSATAWLRPDGRVELRYPEGPVTLSRGLRRGKLAATKGVSVADEVARLLAAQPVSGRVVPLWSGKGLTGPSYRENAAGDGCAEGAGTAPVQGRDVAACAERIRELITAGVLPERPSAHKIRAALGCGMDTAREVRDRLGVA